MDKPNGKLVFYGDEVPIQFPSLYNQFLPLLQEILGLDENFLSSVKLSYRDRDEDKIEIKSEEDYKVFMDEIQKGKQMAMTIEVKEESNLDIKSCSSSILNYVEKKSGNINNLSEEIKKNALGLNEEKNEKNLDLNENINNEDNSNQLIMNNNISNIVNNKDEDKDINKIIIEPKQENNNNNIQNPQQKNKIKIPPINQQNNINNINQNSINNINQNNINNINNVSNINNINNINQVSNQNKINNRYLYMISFPYACSVCKTGPIYRVMYFCKECNIVLCPRCEVTQGEIHIHPFYKVVNSTQFKFLDINGITTMDRIMNRMEGAYNSVLGFFGAGNNQIDASKAQQQRDQQYAPQLVSNVQLARNIYDLRNVTDQQIEEALIKCHGNIDQAVFSLVPK